MSRIVEWCMEWGKGEFGWTGSEQKTRLELALMFLRKFRRISRDHTFCTAYSQGVTSCPNLGTARAELVLLL